LTGGSPGSDDPNPTITPVVINELLTHTDLPAIDAIELFNPTASPVDIGGWFLSDDSAVPKKYLISDGTTLGAGAFITFNESQFNPTPGTNNSFSLSSQGEQVYLFSGDAQTNLTGYSHGVSFGAAANGVSFGRYLNSVGEEQFPAQISLSLGASNTGPRVGPVVINEIHYNPLPGGDEFIELRNITGDSVALFDPVAITNTWQLNGVSFIFPTNITLPPNALLLLVATNPAAFIAKYVVPPEVMVLGPYSGSLQDSGERIELLRPDAPDPGGVPFIVLDGVRYNDKAPWPPAADGSGQSLQRFAAANYADDPINWFASDPTPGRNNAGVDRDGDGIPDSWEIATGTNPDLADANVDGDGDGFTNLEEYISGTNPGSAASVLRALNVRQDAGQMVFEFNATSNRTFKVLFKDALPDPAWSVLTNIGASSQTRVIPIRDATTNASRFYRLTAP
jgi:hypothetical protein